MFRCCFGDSALRRRIGAAGGLLRRGAVSVCLAGLLVLSGVVVLVGALGAAEAQAPRPRTKSPPGASVYFLEPQPGATVGTRFKIRFGLSGMEVSPSGTPKPNSGHHHVIIDTDLPPFDERIPADFNNVHFGGGQTEAELTLPPGEHTLQLLFADHDHIPHDPPLVSKELRIRVVEDAAPPPPTGQAQDGHLHHGAGDAGSVAGVPAAAGRRPSPPGASVYFVYPPDGAVIRPRTTIRFGLKGMGVAPAGIDKANTGHHHLLVDVETPPLDGPLPNDFNHIHLGKGQTEHRLDLKPGEHTLQLVFADERHIPHDPPILSERIRVTVKLPPKPVKAKAKGKPKPKARRVR